MSGKRLSVISLHRCRQRIGAGSAICAQAEPSEVLPQLQGAHVNHWCLQKQLAQDSPHKACACSTTFIFV
jgi:hypothetical protein